MKGRGASPFNKDTLKRVGGGTNGTSGTSQGVTLFRRFGKKWNKWNKWNKEFFVLFHP